MRISWARVAPPPSDTGLVTQVDHSDPQFGGDGVTYEGPADTRLVMQGDHGDPQFGGNGVTFEGPTSFDTGIVMQVDHSDPQFGRDGPTSSDTDTIVAHFRSCHANSLVKV